MKKLFIAALACITFFTASSGAFALDAPEEPVDVLKNAEITYSPSSSEKGENIFDQNTATRWYPYGNANGDFVQAKFKEPVYINKAVIYEFKNAKTNDYVVEKYRLEYSDDGNTWVTLSEGSGIGKRKEINFDRVSVKYLRLCIKFNKFASRADIREMFLYDTKARDSRENKTFYVSPTGSDSADGTINAPFKTIGAAVRKMISGDTCILRGGEYEESVLAANFNSGKKTVFKAYEGETVTISGAKMLNAKWSVYKGNIYVADVAENITQLFAGGRQMNLARWPNADIDGLLNRDTCAKMTTGGYTYFQCDTAPSDIDYSGVKAQLWPGAQWYGYTKELTYDKKENKFIFKEPFAPGENGYDAYDYLKPKNGSFFYLFGVLDLLDCGGEWYYDSAGKKLYFQTENGDSPENYTIKYKVFDYGFNITDSSNVEIDGINFFACAAQLNGAQNCKINNCRFKYISADKNISVRLLGENNSLEKCLIEYAVGNGVTIRGDSNTVENCIIHDVCTYGDYFGAVDVKGEKNKILRNDMYNSGRYIVMHYDSGNLRVEYNKMHGSGKLTSDLGATYEWGTDGRGSVIAYNWIYDCRGSGIYLDNFSENYVLHHNVIHNTTGRGIMLNSDSLNNKVYHNTIFNIGAGYDSFYSFAYSGYQLTNRGCEIKNNIYNGGVTLATGSTAPVMSNNAVVTNINDKFMPETTESIRDKGVFIEGINDYYTGDKPDIGAYEIGGEYWVPGPDWSIEEN